MSESVFHSAAALAALLDLCERIATEAPALEVVALYEFPRPFVKVKDSSNGLVVALSSHTELSLYLNVIHTPQGGPRHA